MINQCASCGKEIPEGDMICRECKHEAEFAMLKNENVLLKVKLKKIMEMIGGEQK